MGLALSTGLTVWKKVLKFLVFTVTNVKETVVVRFISFPGENRETRENSNSVKESNSEPISSSDVSNTMAIEESISVSHQKVPEKLKLETSVSLENLVVDKDAIFKLNRDKFLREFASPRPVIELDEAALKLQKVYKGYRTRRNLADCAVVVEELWWKALEFACLNQSSVSFFDAKPQTAFSRWSRARTRAAKVGKGLSKDEKAQKLALQHWLEAIDPRHRYGHNMHFYYDVWFDSQSPQPFFYWLDVGDGKEVNLEKCPRNVLQKQCIKYLAPNERAAYEVIVENGKLIYRESGIPVNTDESSKWIFVLSTLRNLYVGQKIKGVFQHSSFLSGGATTAAGRLIVNEGVLKAIWPYSGHYLPTEENFKEFISFLEDHNVDLSDVKKYSTDEDISSFKESEVDAKVLDDLVSSTEIETDDKEITEKEFEAEPEEDHTEGDEEGLEGVINEDIPPYLLGKPLSCKWATGAGPRIGCVRDYPVDLQFKALEQVNLSPRVSMEPFSWSNPIPSPRPSPKIRISPRLSQLGIPSPRVTLPPVPQVLYKAS